MTDATAPRGLKALQHSPAVFLMVLAFVNWLGFASWTALLNNFAKEAAGFSGQDIGILQSVREIPGFLAFTAIVLFWFMREQILAYLSLLALGVGVAITGFYPSLGGLLLTTTIMSLGFHYYETSQQSLQLQLLPKAQAPRLLGRIAGASALAQLLAFGSIAVIWRVFQPGFVSVFLTAGLLTIALTLATWLAFPRFQGAVPQNKGFVLRRRYWLYYALTFMSGARRQIFMAFGGFLLVERFGYDVSATATLLLATYGINTFMGPVLGGLVGRLGERATIRIENISLIAVFVGYALASHGHFAGWGVAVAGALFVVDGVFFTLTLAQRTYFQKIADPADIAPTSAVAFTINHIAAVFLPVTFGLLWIKDPAIVFYIGAGIATISLALAFLVPRHPAPGAETVLQPLLPAPAE
ncbi:hypothetical protein ASG72_16860 [Bosea sp. Leaf344]|uniref:MFS transporter n=1 Tax=Bosea sp. Leaf344 TaxID=1736346 RepID=UPI000700F833|nr:MFS transporter [Bosea sp. Leaf344]KQU50295.1 hypothetical protein ASG72_16860 [Bosea sp. Leaf344]